MLQTAGFAKPNQMNAARALQPAPIVTPPRLPAPANSVRQTLQSRRDLPVDVGGRWLLANQTISVNRRLQNMVT